MRQVARRLLLLLAALVCCDTPPPPRLTIEPVSAEVAAEGVQLLQASCTSSADGSQFTAQTAVTWAEPDGGYCECTMSSTSGCFSSCPWHAPFLPGRYEVVATCAPEGDELTVSAHITVTATEVGWEGRAISAAADVAGVAVLGTDNEVAWATRTGRVVVQAIADEQVTYEVTVGPVLDLDAGGGTWSVATAVANQGIVLHDVVAGLQATVPPPSGAATSSRVALHPFGASLAGVGPDAQVVLWSLENLAVVASTRLVVGTGSGDFDLVWDRLGGRLAVASGPAGVAVFDGALGPENTLRGRGGAIRRVAWRTDGLALAALGDTLELFDLDPANPGYENVLASAAIDGATDLAFSPTGDYLLVSARGKLRVLHARTLHPAIGEVALFEPFGLLLPDSDAFVIDWRSSTHLVAASKSGAWVWTLPRIL